MYVDNGLVAATNKVRINKFLKCLEKEFKIKKEPFRSFLNMLITRQDNNSIFINQKMYAESMLQRFKMEEAVPISISMERCQLTEEADDKLIDVPYREAVGCLMYLTVATRFDIAYAVNHVSQFLKEPRQKHWAMIKQILKYIRYNWSWNSLQGCCGN